MSRRPKPQPNRQPLLLPSQRAKLPGNQTGGQPDSARQQVRGDTGAGADSTAAMRNRPHGNAAAETSAAAQTDRTAQAQTKATQYDGTAANAPDAAGARGTALPLGPGVRIVAFHPCGLYVLEKPEGVLSHPNKKAEINRSLLCAPYSLEHEYFYNLHAQGEPAPRKQNAAKTLPAHAESSLCADDTAKGTDSGDDSAAYAKNPAVQRPDTQKTPDTQTLPEKLYLLHRLDSATSGLLLLADNEPLANSVRTAFTEGGVRKTYFALCAATAPMRTGQKGRWSDRLQREHSGTGGGIVHVRTSNSGMSAVTDFACRKTTPASHSLALLELHPISGRTHQLRVHCAQHGLPIIGDGKYGDFRLNRDIAKASGYKRLFLHAAALELNFTHRGEALRLRFAATPPPEFDALLHNPPELNRPAARQNAPRKSTGTAGRPTGSGSRPGRGRK